MAILVILAIISLKIYPSLILTLCLMRKKAMKKYFYQHEDYDDDLEDYYLEMN